MGLPRPGRKCHAVPPGLLGHSLWPVRSQQVHCLVGSPSVLRSALGLWSCRGHTHVLCWEAQLHTRCPASSSRQHVSGTPGPAGPHFHVRPQPPDRPQARTAQQNPPPNSQPTISLARYNSCHHTLKCRDKVLCGHRNWNDQRNTF